MFEKKFNVLYQEVLAWFLVHLCWRCSNHGSYSRLQAKHFILWIQINYFVLICGVFLKLSTHTQIKRGIYLEYGNQNYFQLKTTHFHQPNPLLHLGSPASFRSSELSG